ncbi:MAG: site-2 protease family protein [Alphaproteobacteria bacterium]|nr:site-2 protease family protein [Alphaproteobacteria bacterium]
MHIDPGEIFIGFTVLLFSLTVHEAAHAWSAWKLGDPTARDQGRVSLNPAVHIDPIGTVVFPLLAMITSAPVLGWARPVPVDLRRLMHWRRDHMLIAAAGPVSNLLLAVLAAGVLKVLPAAAPGGFSLVEPVTVMCQAAVMLNIILAAFNFVPVPPLDGGNVLRGLLRGRPAHLFDRVQPYGFFLLYALMLSGALSFLIGPPARALAGWLL